MDKILREKLFDALTRARPLFPDSPALAERVREVTELDIDAIEPIIDEEIERIRETKVQP